MSEREFHSNHSGAAFLDAHIVMELLAELSDAFPSSTKAKNPDGMLRTYRMHLAGVSVEAARGGVRSIVRNDERYPSASRVLAAAHDWTRRNASSPEYQLRHDPNVCQSCRQHFTLVERWRPAVSKTSDGGSVPGAIELTPDRQAVYLEKYSRDVCACHLPCKYEPDGYDGERVTMSIDKIPPHDQVRIVNAYGGKPRTRTEVVWASQP